MNTILNFVGETARKNETQYQHRKHAREGDTDAKSPVNESVEEGGVASKCVIAVLFNLGPDCLVTWLFQVIRLTNFGKKVNYRSAHVEIVFKSKL